jgi:hypothetical protein
VLSEFLLTLSSKNDMLSCLFSCIYVIGVEVKRGMNKDGAWDGNCRAERGIPGMKRVSPYFLGMNWEG